MDYLLCSRQRHCNTIRDFSNCSVLTECVSGCFCSNDYALEDGKCIDPAMCPGELYILTFSLAFAIIVSGFLFTIQIVPYIHQYLFIL